MTVDEMINFDISNFVTQIAKEADLRIVNGVYTISQEYELEFNKEEIKKLLLMFKPLQKELETYKRALELLAEDSTNTSLNEDKQELIDYYLQRAKAVKQND